MEFKEGVEKTCACKNFYCILESEEIYARGRGVELKGTELIGRKRSLLKTLRLKGCSEDNCSMINILLDNQ